MKWLKKVFDRHPLIECVTNSVTINDVANVILAVGASPVMGDEAEEVPDFVRLSQGVLLNVGTISTERIKSFFLAMKTAQECGVPVVLDPVGIGAAAFRTQAVFSLLQSYPCAVIRGNASEVRTLAEGEGRTAGVDVAPDDAISEHTLDKHIQTAARVARKYSCIVSMSGEIDVITDGSRTWLCRNGLPQMSTVTGTGCSLSGLTAAFVAAVSPEMRLDAAARAVAMMGCAGEIAWNNAGARGLGSFHAAIIDALSTLTDDKIDRLAKLTLA